MSINAKHFLSWVNRHNWGHLEKDKDIIIRHLRTYFGDIETLAALLQPAPDLREADYKQMWIDQKRFLQITRASGQRERSVTALLKMEDIEKVAFNKEEPCDK